MKIAKIDRNGIKPAEQKRGIVFDIQHYAIHDGPGIRTLVFMKGCPLCCRWCDNPESQRKLPEIVEFRNKCIGCGECFKVCSVRALNRDKGWHIKRDVCNNCGKCTEVCLTGARTMVGKVVTVSEVMKEVRKDMAFYSASGGGVTLTGGEPVTQLDFSLQLLKACREDRIHTAIETCGYTEWTELEVLLPHTDMILFDLKEMDPMKHQNFTGVSNEKILENIEKLSRRRCAMIIRIPLVRGYNDDVENIHSAALFSKNLPYPPEVELLPYHELGMNKYKALGRKCSFKSVRPLTRDEIDKIRLIFERYGTPVKVHGYDPK